MSFRYENEDLKKGDGQKKRKGKNILFLYENENLKKGDGQKTKQKQHLIPVRKWKSQKG
jgi:hypothetical protein